MQGSQAAGAPRWVAACLMAAAVVAACGGGGDGPPPSAAATKTCAELVGLQIPAASIGLPSGGGIVTATATVPAAGTGTAAVGEYCRVDGAIKPVDPTAPDIQFRVALPTAWNGKGFMLGGGGSNGTLPNVAGNILNAPANAPSPLQRGYAVFGSDSGHQNSATVNAYAFQLNDEAFRNYYGDALKKTRDAALAVLQARYGKAADKSYFQGGSTGGREALTVAARWPADWDGVIVLFPAHEYTAARLYYIHLARALAAPGGYISREKRLALRRAALAACDTLDGAADGVISNVNRCNASFDPATALLDGAPLRCAGGADTGDNCLSDTQIRVLRLAQGSVAFDFAVPGGAGSYPGLNVYTSDTGVPGSGLQATVTNLSAFGAAAPSCPISPSVSLAAGSVDGYVRYAIARDESFCMLNMDPINPAAYAQRWAALSVFEAPLSNMDGFAARNGKMLWAVGTEDMITGPRISENSYLGWRARMGVDAVDKFARFYLVPGFAHSLSTTFQMSWDQITALENWVERGVDPKNNQVVADTIGVPGRTRPLCHYPGWPKYTGSGDVNSAASYVCAVD